MSNRTGLRPFSYTYFHMKRLLLAICCILTSALSYAYDFEVDGYRYTVITSSTAEFSGVAPNYEGEVIIPEFVSYSGKQLSVSTIGEYAFKSYKASFLRIPRHITNIENAAFYDAQIDSLHFEDCENSISLQNTINRGPSMSYSILGSVYIGREINRTDYNSNANGPFYCSSVKKVYIGKTCSLCQELFQSCSSLEQVILKEGAYVSSISSECFRNCSKLKSIDLKKGLTSISSLAFYNCTSLDSIYIPSTVTSINSNAFSGATGIKTVVSASDSPNAISETSFPGIVYLTSTLYVPLGLKAKYETTSGWKEFANIVETDNLPSDNYFYTLNLSVSTGGCISVDNNTYTNQHEIISIKEGDDLKFTIKANDGYYLKSFIVNGEDKTKEITNNSLIISSIKQNTTIDVTFKALSAYLTIKSADNGSIAQEIEKGKAYSFVITPNEGWDIESVSFNGENVTSQLEYNRYTTPAISSDSELNIVYRQQGTINAKSLKSETNVRVSAAYGKLNVDNDGTNTNLSVYSSSGSIVVSEPIGVGTTAIELPTNNIYIVKIGKETFKVSM